MPHILDRSTEDQPSHDRVPSVTTSPRSRAVTTAFALAALLTVTPACDEGGMEAVDDDAGSTTDDLDEPTADDDAVPPASCPAGPDVSMNAQGVLSRYPSQSWLFGSATLVPITANYVVTDDGDGRGPLLEMFVEVRNDGPTECSLLPELSIDGREVLGLFTADPFTDEFSSVTKDCIGPGGVGVLVGVARGITEEDLERSTSVAFFPNPNTFSTPLPAAGPGVLDRSVQRLDSGTFGFTATVVPDRDIYGYGARIYPKDAHGLIVEELLAFPNDLGTLPAGSSWTLETLGTRCSFDEYRFHHSWIEGSASGLVPENSDSQGEERRLREQRRTQMDAIRGSRQALSEL